MKLYNDNAAVEVVGANTTSSFSIAMNGKAFKVLSDTLYQNKIGSIVRELSCNAYDAHVMNGNKEVPFHIHLPDAFEPWFSVKDFGVGLSPESIRTVFTVYFESTKDQSNDAIGAFGLGAKTPFSYTDQFTISSIWGGKLNVYSAFITSSGVPDLALMHTEDTSEATGVEINMSVRKEDFSTFTNEVLEQLKYFSVKPTLCNSTVEFPVEVVTPLMDTEDVCIYRSVGVRQCLILQGQIAYPLNINLLGSKISPQAYSLVNALRFDSTQLKFAIGEIGVTASREGVEYDNKTVANIDAKLLKIKEVIAADVASKLNDLPSVWEKSYFLSKHTLFRACVDIAEVPQVFRLPNGFNYIRYTRGINKPSPCGVQNAIYPNENLAVFIKDKSTLAAKKREYFFKNNPDISNIIEVSAREAQLLGAQPKLLSVAKDEISAALGGFSEIVFMSEYHLPKIETERIKAARVKTKVPDYYEIPTYSSDTTVRDWNKGKKSVENLQLSKTVVYFVHSIFSCAFGYLVTDRIKKYRALATPNVTLICLKQETLDKLSISEKSKMVELEKYLKIKKDELQEKYAVQKRQTELYTAFNHLEAYEFFNKIISIDKDVNPFIANVYKKREEIKENIKDYIKVNSHVLAFITEDTKEPRVKPSDVAKKFQKSFFSKYPMLKNCASHRIPAEDVVQYVRDKDLLAKYGTTN